METETESRETEFNEVIGSARKIAATIADWFADCEVEEIEGLIALDQLSLVSENSCLRGKPSKELYLFFRQMLFNRIDMLGETARTLGIEE